MLQCRLKLGMMALERTLWLILLQVDILLQKTLDFVSNNLPNAARPVLIIGHAVWALELRGVGGRYSTVRRLGMYIG